MDWYLKEGCPALFFPEASDPEIYRPMPELPKIHDGCFVGGCYGIRREIVAHYLEGGAGLDDVARAGIAILADSSLST